MFILSVIVTFPIWFPFFLIQFCWEVAKGAMELVNKSLQ